MVALNLVMNIFSTSGVGDGILSALKGNNPETSAVNRWGFSHEAPNLGLLGGSVMVTSGARNPTLTIQALAWRTADRPFHLIQLHTPRGVSDECIEIDQCFRRSSTP